MQPVLLFGGSFDPVHHGHLIVVRHVAETLGVARVVLLPSAVPPHKQTRTLAPAAQRLELCRAAVADDPMFEVSDWETRQTGPNYTLLTIRHFQHECGPGIAIHWLIGMDSLGELHTWYHARELADACTIVTAARPGFEPPAADVLARDFASAQVERLLQHVILGPRIDISSTDIRARVARGASIRYLVPDAVRADIERRGMYRGPT